MPKKKEMPKQLTVTWKKSTIGRTDDQIATIKALGLHRLNQSVVKEDNPVIRGMIQKVQHLVEVTEG
jgi:large subunit ribosomal protein L30